MEFTFDNEIRLLMKVRFAEVVVSFTDVEGKCYVRYVEDENTDTWLKEGPNRFYFQETYNSETEAFETPRANLISKGKGGKVN